GLLDGTVVRPFEHDSEYQGRMDRRTRGVTGKLTWKLSEDLEFKSISNYTDMKMFYTEDGDAFPILVINFSNDVDYKQWSQELRLSGDGGIGRWQAGLYYLSIDFTGNNTFDGLVAANEGARRGIITAPPGGFNPFNFPAGAATLGSRTLESTNWSVFAQDEFDFTDRLTGILGVRWSQDDKKLLNHASYRDDNTPLTQYFDVLESIAASGDPAYANANKINYGDYAARAQLNFKATDDTLLFASYNRGIKGGNFSTGVSVSLPRLKHDEEVLHSFEIGVKTDIGDIARLNATAFYYDYDGYQAFALTNVTPQITNTDARAKGAEIELYLAPAMHWNFVFGASFEDSWVAEVLPINALEPLRGNELPNAPHYSFNFLGRYDWNVLGGNMALQLDGVSYGHQFLEVTNSEVSRENAYTVWNASLAYVSPDDRWTLTAAVKNIGNEAYRLYDLDLGAVGTQAFYAPPRIVGFTASYKF
ncbi:MAG: TonB-dependent receptor, partial [Gammaproteobacteria bacterium]